MSLFIAQLDRTICALCGVGDGVGGGCHLCNNLNIIFVTFFFFFKKNKLEISVTWPMKHRTEKEMFSMSFVTFCHIVYKQSVFLSVLIFTVLAISHVAVTVLCHILYLGQ